MGIHTQKNNKVNKFRCLRLFFRNDSGIRPEKRQKQTGKKRKHFPKKERNLLSFKVWCILEMYEYTHSQKNNNKVKKFLQGVRGGGRVQKIASKHKKNVNSKTTGTDRVKSGNIFRK